MKKRLLCAALAFLLAFGLMPAAYAVEAGEPSGVEEDSGIDSSEAPEDASDAVKDEAIDEDDMPDEALSEEVLDPEGVLPEEDANLSPQATQVNTLNISQIKDRQSGLGWSALGVSAQDPCITLSASYNWVITGSNPNAGISCSGTTSITLNNARFGTLSLGGDITLALSGVNTIVQREFTGTFSVGSGTVRLQSADAGGLGTLNVTSNYGNTQFTISPAIYVGGTLIVNSGIINATTTHKYTGAIGGRYNSTYRGTITINGGVVTAKSSGNGAAIGAGYRSNAGTVNINGGTVIAISTGGGSGIGNDSTGLGASLATVKINGGSVYTSGHDGSPSITPRSPQNSRGQSLYLATFALRSPNAQVSGYVGPISLVASTSPGTNQYGANDLKTDASGKVYLWLPLSAASYTYSLTAGGQITQGSLAMTTNDKAFAPTLPASLVGKATTISTALPSGRSIDISGKSTANGAQAIIWSATTSANQRFVLEAAGDGSYYIKNVNSGKVLDISGASIKNGAAIIQWPQKSTGNLNQRWYVLPNADGSYTFASALDSRYGIDVNGVSDKNGAALILWTLGTNKKNQGWRIAALAPSLPDGIYTIRTMGKGARSLDIEGNSLKGGARMLLWDFHGKTNQQFRITYQVQTGYYTITCVRSGMSVDVSGGSLSSGAQIIQWPLHSRLNQQWSVAPNNKGNGSYWIIGAASGLSLDVSGGNVANNGRIIQWPYHGNYNQQWSFARVG